jgi:hypothetical protein
MGRRGRCEGADAGASLSRQTWLHRHEAGWGPGKCATSKYGDIVYLLPALFILLVVGQYIHPISLCVGLSLALWGVNLYARLGGYRVGVRLAVFTVASLAVYFVTAGLYSIFAGLCGCYEWRVKRQRWLGAACLACAAVVPYAASWWPFDLIPSEAFGGLLLPRVQHWLAIPSSMPQALAIHTAALAFPLLAAVFCSWRGRPVSLKLGMGPFVAKFARIPIGRQHEIVGILANSATTIRNPQLESPVSEAIPSPRESGDETSAGTDEPACRSWRAQLAVPLAILLLFVLADLVAFDSPKRCLLEIECASEQRRWDDVLVWAEQLPFPDARAYDPRILYCINRALFFKGLLLDKMFAYPQVCSTPSLTLIHEDIDTTSHLTPRQCSEIFFDLGRFNESEQMAYEALEQCGNRPEILKRLVSIYLIKEQPEAARRFLLLLDRSLLHRGWARQLLQQLDADPAFSDTLCGAHRELAVQRDSLGDAGNEETLLTGLLERNPRNRMALEYLMAHYLLTRQTDKLFAHRDRFERPDGTRFPRHVEQALACYLALAGQEILERESQSIHPETWQGFVEFVEAERRSAGDPSAAFAALYPDFHDTYFFCLTFGHNIPSLVAARTPE